MLRKTAFLFSGQGAQYYQMGRSLYEDSSTFRGWMDRMDAQVEQSLGTSVLREIFGSHGRADPFDALRLTHPALFMVEYALARTVMQLGVVPDYTLGASLGTLVALAVSGHLPLESALQLVLEQAQIIEEHCPTGGLIAVMAEPRLYWTSPALRSLSVVAGQNFASHFVLAMPQAHLREVEAVLRAADATHQRLPVRYPFHSPWMDPVRDRLIQASLAHRLGAGTVPLVCCALSGVLETPPTDYFWRVARDPIDFMRTIARMEALSAFDYVDLSPSGTLATFLKYQLGKDPPSRFVAVMSPFGGETTASVSAALSRLSRLSGARS
jgi:bacillaene synthase trans-acting acyltransferase